ncbi:hypothetical protein GCM10012283_27440 [Phycicoccus endophyticus]|nr:hypothetical protein GCM10012283_27440 [Phycicoccus endophyticus]
MRATTDVLVVVLAVSDLLSKLPPRPVGDPGRRGPSGPSDERQRRALRGAVVGVAHATSLWLFNYYG